MGAWSVASFGNDTACDWAYSLAKTSELDLVRETLQKVLDSDDYVEKSDAERAIAAIEVVARLKGHFGERDSHTQTVDNWVESNAGYPPQDLVMLCSQVLDRILSPSCGLYEMWQESGEFEAWHNSVLNLKNRACN